MMKTQELRRVIVIGSGAIGIKTAQRFSEEGYETKLLTFSFHEKKETKKNGLFRWISGGSLRSVSGGVGDFHLSIALKNKMECLKVDVIVVAFETVRSEESAWPGLHSPAPYDGDRQKGKREISSGHIFSFLRFERYVEELPDKSNMSCWADMGGIAFICGLYRESHPIMVKKILTLAYQLRTQYGVPIYFLTQNLKVAKDGMEGLCWKSRREGIIFHKFTGILPLIKESENGKISIHFEDSITGNPSRLSPHYLVFEDIFLPDNNHVFLSKLINLPLCEDGSLSTDNVHHYSVKTLNKGIFTIGGSRGIIDGENVDEEIENVLYEVQLLRKEICESLSHSAFIDTGLCSRCLTCYRSCSYSSIDLKEGKCPDIMPMACEACGICVSVCPGKAISLSGNWLKLSPESDPMHAISENVSSKIVVFCCKRSAVFARSSIFFEKFKRDERIVFLDVPCAGGVSEHMLIDVFDKDAAGVMVFKCHPGNCHSELGTNLARKRVERIIDLLEVLGIDKKRVALFSLAANMGVAMGEKIEEFIRIVYED